jgi:hypothetical protein
MSRDRTATRAARGAGEAGSAEAALRLSSDARAAGPVRPCGEGEVPVGAQLVTASVLSASFTFATSVPSPAPS